MPPPQLSRLQQVSIRDVWPTEPQHFTPWLAQAGNLVLLAEAIGLRLELQSTEEPVGDFRADIVCKSIPDGDLVLVENQFEQTDHTHLGQILTYLAGLEAATIVWIAERVRDEHRAAIDWLNENTPENINFFALEIELWRIADSPVAPKFNVVCKPNEWTRSTVAAARDTSDLGAWRYSYWSSFAQQPALQGITVGPVQPKYKGNIGLPVAWHDFRLQVYISPSEEYSAVYLSCRGANRFQNFATLKSQREQIEKCIGAPLSWELSEANNRAWISLNLRDLNPSNKDDWPRQQEILAEKTVAFYRCLDPFVRPLDGSPTPHS